ncbi:exopolysaccharide biosynthesis polyprenyl glycosylphosphotransferase [Blastococcus sp. KM273128]|uniref:exopolysaccharide biosynthesis polyprenyl glycosylphosphotransferase n=1 Tax=Blastococcus sp. KM273128 TaxID=2570314 RepID=UPI001EFF852D|nr:exopolysaccharide biosynthesis polyprenyl glycosylphosphotransferase [Blastococcus sp. KM273128]MCF6746243.1 exopolysaccharide biosynthesis polyprenyl glycosylphosphotransferase [Blastococcus sp. KM273128]
MTEVSYQRGGVALPGVPRPRSHGGTRPAPSLRSTAVDLAPPERVHDRTALVRAGLLAVDAAALALPMTWLGGPGAAGVVFAVVALLVLAATGAHHPRITLSVLDEAPRLLPRLGVALLLVAPVLPSSAAAVALHAAWAVPCVVVGRGLGYAAVRAARRRAVVADPTLVVGGGRLGMELLATMREHPELGLRGVGYLADGRPLDEREPLGRLEDLELVLDTYGVRKVVVAYGPTREAALVDLVRSAALRDIEVYVVPRFFDVGMAAGGPDVEDLWGIPLHRVRRAALRRGARQVKRLVDVAVAGTALALLAPVMGLLALAVRVSSPGPVLFRQPRTGQDGARIEMLKFRTLRMAADEAPVAAGSTRSTMHARQVDVEQRQTRIGTVLRRTSLDELPQLWNILRGDMSLVGPRPEECTYAARFADSVHGYRDRHRLTVGLTGWAQVHGLRGDTSIEERARFDNAYIEQWSLWRDVVILIRTVAAVQRQAFRTAVRTVANC